MSRTLEILTCGRKKKFEFDNDARFFFTSDTHYGHGNIIVYSSRPFLTDEDQSKMPDILAKGKKFRPSQESIEKMNDGLVARFNEVVRPIDVIIHHGDYGWEHGRRDRHANSKEFHSRVNCKNWFLIWGNHDEPEMGDLISNNYDQCQIFLPNGKSIHSTHFPSDSWWDSHKGRWHLFGHVHGVANERRSKIPSWALSIDCGVDSHNYYPWSETQLESYFSKQYTRWKEDRDGWKDKEQGGMTPSSQLK